MQIWAHLRKSRRLAVGVGRTNQVPGLLCKLNLTMTKAQKFPPKGYTISNGEVITIREARIRGGYKGAAHGWKGGAYWKQRAAATQGRKLLTCSHSQELSQ